MLALGGCGPCDDVRAGAAGRLAVGHADGVLYADSHGVADSDALA